MLIAVVLLHDSRHVALKARDVMNSVRIKLLCIAQMTFMLYGGFSGRLDSSQIAVSQELSQEPSDVLAELANAMEQAKLFSFDARSREYGESATLKQKTLLEDARFEVVRSDSSMRLSKLSDITDVRGGKTADATGVFELVVNPDRSISLSTAKFKGAADNPKDLFVSADLTPEAATALGWRELGWTGFALGYVPGNGDKRISELLQGIQPKSVVDKDSGEELIRFEGRSSYGKIVADLDPHAYLPVKVVITKEGRDLIDGTPLSEMRPAIRSGGVWPQSKLKRLHTEIKDVRFALVDGVNAITHFVVLTAYSYDDGESVVIENKVDLSKITSRAATSPKDFQLKTRIPNGTPVTVADESSFNFEWVDGRVEKMVNVASLRRIEQQERLVATGTARRWWMIGLNVALVIVLIIAVMHYRRARIS